MSVPLTKYGLREIVLATAIAAGVFAAGAYLAGRLSGWFWLVPVLAAADWIFVLSFFRDPRRHVPAGEGLFVSPADGRVSDLTPIGPDGELGRDGLRIGIFMSVFDVHVNRAPCDGRVEVIEHRPGAYLDARDPSASTKNESATITMTHVSGGRGYPLAVRQIAGLIARRIVTDLESAQQVRRGERIGMIKFGSRVEVLAPRELVSRLCVEVGQKVKAGETILFEAPRTQEP